MTKVLANALVPIFAGLLLGYFAGLWRRMDNQNVRTLITFVMSFAIPCSLFLAIASTPRAALREQAAAGLVLAIVYAVLYAVSFVWTRFRENLNASDSSVVALTLGFPTQQRSAYHCSLRFSVREPRSRWPHLSQSAPSLFLRLPWQFLNEVAGAPLGSPELGSPERARRCGKSHCRLSIPARGLLFGRHCWGWRFLVQT